MSEKSCGRTGNRKVEVPTADSSGGEAFVCKKVQVEQEFIAHNPAPIGAQNGKRPAEISAQFHE